MHWAGTVLCAKFFAGLVRREFGLAPDFITGRRSGLSVDLTYLCLLVAFSIGVKWVGLNAALLLAILLRLGSLVSSRVLIAANHHFVEFFAMVMFLRLNDTPLTLAAAGQVMYVSMWLYAAFQKLYHGQFADGSFFYILFQDNPSNRWPGMKRRVGRIGAYYAPIDCAGLNLCQRLALGAVATEIIAPIVALAFSGTWWSVLAVAGASGVIAFMSGETSFMITNLVLAALFLVPFDWSALLLVMHDPIATAVLGYFLVWPAIHAVMTRRLRISTWKLGGWGMYATISPGVCLITPQGELVPQTAASIALGVIEAFGACRIPWLRGYAQRVFLRWHPDAKNVVGFEFHWYERRNDGFITKSIVFPNRAHAAPTVFVLDDEASVRAFKTCVASLQDSSATERNRKDRYLTLDSQAETAAWSPLPNCTLEEL